MKIKEDLVLRQVADTWVVVPLSSAVVRFDGVLNLNESGATLWKVLEQGASKEELVEAMMAEYAVSREVAVNDIDEFINSLNKNNCLDA